MDYDRVSIRPAVRADLARITEIINYYIVHTHITFDVKPFRPEDRLVWFEEHNSGGRYQMLVAEENGLVIGYVATGRFRNKGAYDTTVEASIALAPQATGRGIGTRLYTALFEALANQDVNRLVAGIAQPNDGSNALHQRMGFTPVGTFTAVGRKFGKYWDVLWMEKAGGERTPASQ